ncbi:hypothetical protein Hanom_Chr06g00563561 [Helianthus anomalus]
MISVMEKGHFKRECINREASGAQNPFGNNDYCRKAIHHQPYQQPETSHARKPEEKQKRALVVNQDDEKLAEGFSWDKYVPPVDEDYHAFVAEIYEDTTTEEELEAYAYYQSQQYIPPKIEEEPIVKEKVEVAEKAPVFDHSYDEESDDEEEMRKLEFYQKKFLAHQNDLNFAGNDEEIEEKKAAKKEKAAPAEGQRKPEMKKQVEEIPAVKIVEEEVVANMPIMCENCYTVRRHNNKLIHNINRLQESYEVLNKLMNRYTQSSEEQATAMKTLRGAFMTKQKVLNQYIEKCAELEQKLETQRIETERVDRLLKSYSHASYVIDRIYPTVEGMKSFEEEQTPEVIRQQI